MKAEIKGENLLVYCDNHESAWKFIEANKIERHYTGPSRERLQRNKDAIMTERLLSGLSQSICRS